MSRNRRKRGRETWGSWEKAIEQGDYQDIPRKDPNQSAVSLKFVGLDSLLFHPG